MVEESVMALCLPSPAESDADSDSDSESEWRDAVRRALEEELQRKVRLRLSLDAGALPALCSPSRNPRQGSFSFLAPRRRRAAARSVGDLTRHTLPPHPSSSTTTVTTTSSSRPQQGTRKENGNGGSRHSQATKPSAAASGGGGGGGRGGGGGGGGGEKDDGAKKEPPTLFQYLHAKYGTPIEQLQRLADGGTFRTNSSDQLSSSSHRIFWPVEAHITQPTPTHLRTPSHTHTPLYQNKRVNVSTCEEMKKRGRMIYNCTTAAPLKPGGGVSLTGEAELVFESRFEGGNLHQAMLVGPREYNLILRNDLYTRRHTQWFYFQVSGMEAGVTYRFNIINLMKKDSLYNYGLQPLLYSEREANCQSDESGGDDGDIGKEKGKGWRRVGYDIIYYQCPRHGYTMLSSGGDYYTLSWKMEFPCSKDTCYLAHCYPYSYSSLLSLFDTLESTPERAQYIKREVLCRSLAGNPCHALTITDFDTPSDQLSGRHGVVLSARVHPGESNSSWMMEGALDFLTSDHHHAKSLRSHYVFKVVPMLNPDGVVVGNYRTSLAGIDLNRVYRRPLENLFPTVYHTKAMVAQFMEEREVVLYVDLHGHSRKHNVFMYGCHVPQCSHTHFLNERVVPFLLSQQAPDKFCFRSCKFAVEKYKEATGRVVSWRMGVPHSFTLESTFCGATLQQSHQFTEHDLMSVGRDLCEVVYRFHRFNKSRSYQQKVLASLASLIMESLERSNPPPAHGREAAQTVSAVPLPDIITSATPQVVAAAPADQESTQARRKSRSKHSSKVLHQFMKLDVTLLEAESSTSGSDSDNDEFEYHKRKHNSKHRRRKRHRSLSTQTHTQLLLQHQTQPGTKKGEHGRQALSIPSPPPSPPLPHRASHKQHASAPARLQGKRLPVTGSHRFINRYANRSNGGIPMFSEERLKERAEKQRLRSLSMVQQPVLQPHNPPNTDTLPQPSSSASVDPSTSTQSMRTLPFLWRPVESQDETEPLQFPSLSHPQTHPPPLPSSHNHYQSIKGLVEFHRKPVSPKQLGASLFTSSHIRPHPHHSLQLAQLMERQRAHKQWRRDGVRREGMKREGDGVRREGVKREGDGVRREGGRSILSPRLARYISDIWSKNLN